MITTALPTAAKLWPLLGLFCLLSACASQEPPQNAPMAHAPAKHTHAQGKTQAPVSLRLTLQEQQPGQTVATFLVTATQDYSSATARFVPPANSQILQGKVEVPLGAMKSGQSTTLTLTLQHKGQTLGAVIAGVDVQVSPGVQLHKSVSSPSTNTPPKGTGTVKTMPNGKGARIGGVK